jgi:hypothetical protein
MNKDKKITRIKTLISRLEAGDTVSNRSLSRVLTNKQLKALGHDWKEEQSFRKVAKPLAIKKYEAMIKTALLLYSRADKMYFQKSPTHKIKAMSNRAELAFTDAFLFLEEAIEIDSNIQLWIDRDLKDASFDPIGIPRVIGSSSFECRRKEKVPFPVLTKRQLKILVLEQALETLEIKPNVSLKKMVPFLCPPRKALNFEGFVY